LRYLMSSKILRMPFAMFLTHHSNCI
jgi:hypothetical protein